jgi:hypothetical protein
MRMRAWQLPEGGVFRTPVFGGEGGAATMRVSKVSAPRRELLGCATAETARAAVAVAAAAAVGATQGNLGSRQ